MLQLPNEHGEWHVEHAVGRKWRRIGVTFPNETPEADLRAYLSTLAERHNCARVVHTDGKREIEIRRSRVLSAGEKRGRYSSSVTRA